MRVSVTSTDASKRQPLIKPGKRSLTTFMSPFPLVAPLAEFGDSVPPPGVIIRLPEAALKLARSRARHAWSLTSWSTERPKGTVPFLRRNTLVPIASSSLPRKLGQSPLVPDGRPGESLSAGHYGGKGRERLRLENRDLVDQLIGRARRRLKLENRRADDQPPQGCSGRTRQPCRRPMETRRASPNTVELRSRWFALKGR